MKAFLSPAKVNLFLKVVGRRADGYHDLASLFQTVDLYDTIRFTPADDDSLLCDDPSLSTDSNNLINRAVKLFRERTGYNKAYTIHLEKRIPMQAGLGGGSSNAATTLWALRNLSGIDVSNEELCKWGEELGSDVPFFLASHGTAYCTGKGEVVRDLPPFFSQQLHLIKPPEGVSTPAVFRGLDLTSLQFRDPELALRNFIAGKPEYFNDLENPVLTLKPSLQYLKQELMGYGFTTVMMTGSGSSFFCLGNANAPLPSSCFVHTCFPINRTPGFWYGFDA